MIELSTVSHIEEYGYRLLATNQGGTSCPLVHTSTETLPRVQVGDCIYIEMHIDYFDASTNQLYSRSTSVYKSLQKIRNTYH